MNKLTRILPSGVQRVVRSAAMKMSGVAPLPPVTIDTRPLEGSPPLRCGIVGLGFMGKRHADAIRGRKHVKLTAIASTDPKKRPAAEEMGCRWFASADEMIRSGEVDAIVIATPHWQHPAAAIAALRAGLHVICEKPLAVTVSAADSMLDAARQSKGLLTVVYQSRFEPAYQYAKGVLASGELGEIIRCEMTQTMWRSQAYYESGPWRGTWKGEGGGVLINQAPHLLDRYVWLCGVPKSVTGFCDTTSHKIEVEDTATAVFRHANGTHGHVHISTSECPAVARTVISCDRGRVTIDDGVVRVARLDSSIRQRTASDPATTFGEIAHEARELSGGGPSPEPLGLFYDRFALAAARKEPVFITGEEALRSLELANAILLSSADGRAVDLPLDRAAYDAFIAARIGTA